MTQALQVDLSGRRAFVTGSSRGLGLASARALARAGADVGLLGRQPESVAAAVTDVEQHRATPGQRVMAFTGDLATTEGVQGVIADAARSQWDIVVNCAGVAHPGSLAEIDPADWSATMAVNVTAPFLLSQALSVPMMERGWGRIISVSSHSGLRPSRGSLAYSVSKAALQMLSTCLATELGPHGVRSNVICPTIFLSDMGREFWSDLDVLSGKIEQIPAKRLARVTELADVILFLASPAADYINGAVLPVDGGLFAGRPAASGVTLANLDEAELSPNQR